MLPPVLPGSSSNKYWPVGRFPKVHLGLKDGTSHTRPRYNKYVITKQKSKAWTTSLLNKGLNRHPPFNEPKTQPSGQVEYTCKPTGGCKPLRQSYSLHYLVGEVLLCDWLGLSEFSPGDKVLIALHNAVSCQYKSLNSLNWT